MSIAAQDWYMALIYSPWPEQINSESIPERIGSPRSDLGDLFPRHYQQQSFHLPPSNLPRTATVNSKQPNTRRSHPAPGGETHGRDALHPRTRTRRPGVAGFVDRKRDIERTRHMRLHSGAVSREDQAILDRPSPQIPMATLTPPAFENLTRPIDHETAT